MNRPEQLKSTLEAFQEKCIGLATWRGTSYEEWEAARSDVLAQPEFLRRLPEWVSSTRSGSQFWALMKATAATYQGRREFIWRELGPLFTFVELGATEPTAASLEGLLETCSSDTVGEAWAKIQSRRLTDPEGTITAARSLLEATCKYILDELEVEYAPTGDLRSLYKTVANAMNLSPESHAEQLFKQILSGCATVVNGLAALRNAFGDAHGRSSTQAKPTGRHADLAVNLSGTLCAFLIATFEEQHRGQTSTEAV